MNALREAARRHGRHYAQRLHALQEAYDGGEWTASDTFDQEWSQIRQAHAWASAAEDQQDRALAWTLLAIGFDLLTLRRPPLEVLEWADAAVGAAQAYELSDPHELLNLRGSANLGAGNLDAALRDFSAALEGFRSVRRQGPTRSDPAQEAGYLGNLGLVYTRMGRHREAVAAHQQAVEITRDLGDQRRLSPALANLGLAYAELGDVEKAVACYEQALQAARTLGDEALVGGCLALLASSYIELQQLERAASSAEEALDIAARRRDQRAELSALDALAEVYVRLGRVDAALGIRERALELARTSGNQFSEAAELYGLGRLLSWMERHSEALAHLTAAEEQFTDLGLEQPASAVREFIDAAHDELPTDVLGPLGLELLESGRWEQALAIFERALAASRACTDRRAESRFLGHLGFAYLATGDTLRAAAYYAEAIAIDRELKDSELLANHLANRATLHFREGRRKPALEGWTEALAAARRAGARAAHTAEMIERNLAEVTDDEPRPP